MKKQLTTLFLLIIAHSSIWGQFNFETTGTNDLKFRTAFMDRLTIFNNGDVGIGTNVSAGYKLYVNGSSLIKNLTVGYLAGVGTRPVYADVNGFLVEGTPPATTNVYTKEISISSASARNTGTAAASNFTYMATFCLAYFSGQIPKTDGQIVMPVEFPDNAILTKMYISAVDNVSDGYLNATLYGVAKSGSSSATNNLTGMSTSVLALSPNVQEVVYYLPSFITIDNANLYYYILVTAGGTGTSWGGPFLALRGVKFTYQITY